ncbi:MAG TPA: PfkB family carbohydrate kinase, partial [candidate division Zixibacteria bacterium]|nr:PfkB family carbohydrate kinase [candidate division Zixibacteria bacterium]
AFGHHLADVLARNGVETRGMRFDEFARTTMAFIAMPDPDTAEFVFYRNPGADMLLHPDELDLGLLEATKVLHFGSLSLVDDPIRHAAFEAIEVVSGAGGMISLDVNYRPTLWPSPELAIEAVTAVLPRVNLVKVNEVELALLTGGDDLSLGSQHLLSLGPDICVITLGKGGSYFRVPAGDGFIPSFDVGTVDATGCGDGFVAGLLTGLLTHGHWSEEISIEKMSGYLTFANAVGALTAQTLGVIPALPTLNMVEDFLSRHSEKQD